MATHQKAHRAGHAGISAILNDIHSVLPPERDGNISYRRCRTTFGLMKSALQKAEADSDCPPKEYIELQKLEPVLRQHLQNITTTKGIPAKMTDCLNELKVAVAEVIDNGWTILDTPQSREEVEAMTGEVQKRNRVVTEMELQVWKDKAERLKDELREEKEKVARLNGENNNLTMQLRAMTSERDRLQRNQRHQYSGSWGGY